MRKYGKFAALIAIVVGVLVWLAMAQMKDSSTYYKEIAELSHMGDQAFGRRLRVGGDVAKGSIEHAGKEVRFTLIQEKLSLKVVYAGIDPLPDTFRDGAQALVDGRLEKDNVFRASKIQAKCASKYEAKPGDTKTPSNVNTAKSAI